MFEKFDIEQKEALIKTLMSYAAKTQNKSDEELASVLTNEDETFNTEALNVLLTNNSEHIKTLQGNSSKMFDDGYSKGKKEILTRAENDIKTKYGITTDGKLEDLVELAINNEKDALTATFESKQITDADIQASVLYQNLAKSVEDKDKEWADKFATRDRELLASQTRSKVAEYAAGIVASLKPVFDADPQRAKNQEAFLLKEICDNSWTIEDGKIHLVDEQGIYVKTEQGFRVDTDKFIKGVVTKYHSLQANSQHNSFGQQPSGGANPGAMPKNSNEYIAKLKTLNKPEDAADKQQLKDWAKEQAWY